MMLLHLSAFLLLSLSLSASLASAQSNGDVRLVGGSKTYEGRLEIFLEGQWGTFCGADTSKFSKGAAMAACRQLGYLDTSTYGSVNELNLPGADSGTPMHVGSATGCDYGARELHILRCDVSQHVDSSECSQETAIGVVCEDATFWVPSHTYNTIVRTSSSEYTSFGVLEIFINNTWGNICGTEFNQEAADSACRQMGYTNAASYRTNSHSSQGTVWLDGVTCDSATSCDCLNRCFTAPSSPAKCNSGDFVYVECTFELSLKDSATTGSKDVCSEEGVCSGPGGGGSVATAVVAGIIVGVFFLVVLVLVVCTVALCLLMPSCLRRQRRSYKVIGVN